MEGVRRVDSEKEISPVVRRVSEMSDVVWKKGECMNMSW